MSKGGDNEVKETAYQKELAKTAAKEWNRYQDKFVPLENEYIADAHKMGGQAVYDRTAQDTNTAYNAAFSNAGEQTDKHLAASGVDPTSGKRTAAQDSLINSRLEKENQSVSQADQDATNRYTNSLSNVVAMGRGQQTQAVNSLQDVARSSGQKAQNEAINKANEISVPGAVVGAGASIAANNPDWFKKQNSLSDYQGMKSGSTSGFSPMGGASSYGMKE
ncbi:hypothetical protein [Vibrio sp. ER1A]|uniref:hypothetical protein n=1 Tax=Vibrio sp. ER1A TaxID=1517681 RepID=UPI00068CC661|nr:hypothetical protein [Vibrio sp. ER1A]